MDNLFSQPTQEKSCVIVVYAKPIKEEKMRNYKNLQKMLLIIAAISIAVMSCDSTKPGALVVFDIENHIQWFDIVETIKTRGNNHSYMINIINDFDLPPTVSNIYDPWNPNYTFGSARRIKIEIRGNQTITSNKNDLSIAPRQNMTIRDVILSGTRVSIATNAVFSMKGNASVRDNEGDGIRCSGRFFMFDNSTVENNEVGVSVSPEGIFEMISGKITNNQTESLKRSFASGVVTVGTFIMHGGIISDNFANAGRGGTIVVNRYGNFVMKGGVIKSNTNPNNCSAIYVEPYGSFTMIGGIVYGSVESGVSEDYANISDNQRATLFVDHDAIAMFGDGSHILPYLDNNPDYTDHTIVGRGNPLENEISNYKQNNTITNKMN